MEQGPPKNIHPYVTDFCQPISSSAEPFFIKVTPGPRDIEKECTINVARQIKEKGGEAVTGWKIWEWYGIMIEAEFHTIWKAPDGKLHDITPNAGEHDEVLFLHNHTLKYEGKQIDNIRKPLNKDPNVPIFISVNEDIFAIMNEGDRASQYAITLSDAEMKRYRELEILKLQLGTLIAKKPPERNELCRCGSGIKAKKCCFR